MPIFEIRKISEITSAVEILFDRSRRLQIHFAEYLLKAVLWETSRKIYKIYLKRTPLQIFPKVAGKFPKKIGVASENSNIFYKIFSADAKTSKWPFCSFTLMKSCYSKRYIKIHGLQPSQTPYFFT